MRNIWNINDNAKADFHKIFEDESIPEKERVDCLDDLAQELEMLMNLFSEEQTDE